MIVAYFDTPANIYSTSPACLALYLIIIVAMIPS